MSLNKTDSSDEQSLIPPATGSHTEALPISLAVPAATYQGQWHLYNPNGIDINVLSAWNDYSGRGIKIGVVDEGIQYTHPELAANYDGSIDYDSLLNTNDGINPANAPHGTAVAGVIAARNDGIGTTGVAFNSQVASFRFLGSGSTDGTYLDLIEVIRLQADRGVDVSNNSWGWVDPFGGNALYEFGVKNALQYGVTTGRDGLGTNYVFAAGNSRQSGDNLNYSELHSSRFSIAVAAEDPNGHYSYFSTPGAGLLLSAPGSNIYTTDLVGSAGWTAGNYATVSGTSFASPIVSGVIALMLEANPNLGYRDVQEILAYSARQTDATNASWEYNGATNWNGGGLHASEDYGFGNVDATSAVRLAETWNIINSTAAAFGNEASRAISSGTLNFAINNLSPVSTSLNVGTGLNIDHVEVQLNLTHSWVGDLDIKLISPSGTTSSLFHFPENGNDSTNYSPSWTLNSTQHWGETGVGNWTLQITDQDPADSGLFTGWTLTLYGDALNSNNTYIYTNEFSQFNQAGNSARRNLSDSSGNDTLNAAAVTSNLTINLAPGSINTIAGNTVTIDINTTIENVSGGDGNDSITGNSVANTLWGGRGNDTLYGMDGSDTLYGAFGDDTLDGGTGNDTLQGGAGNDTYYLDSLSDVIIENLNEGTDTIYTASSYTLSNNLENIVLTGSGNINATGNAANNLMIGNAGNNILDGGTGADTMSGGLGDDTYVVDNASDIVTENTNAGNDTVQSYIHYVMAGNLENAQILGAAALSLLGNTLDNIITGNSGNNIINGGEGNDSIDGGAGNDTLHGGAGNDTFYIDSSGDVVVENLNEGIDTVMTSASFVMGPDIENAQLLGTANLSLMGNALNNILTGNSGNNIINGGAGNDVIDGGAGNDILYCGGGSDTLIGGMGNDIFVIDGIGDTVIENNNEGIDTVQSLSTYSLASVNNIENLTLLGLANINATGNGQDNIITGNAGSNILDGGGGNDTLVGGDGNDTYYIDSVSDVITETATGGVDTVFAAWSFILAANLENLTLQGSGHFTGTGNSLNNTLTGNTGNNVLNGGTGNDVLIGGAGDDTYIIDSASDVIIESVNGGIDTVQAFDHYAMGANLENAQLMGSATLSLLGNTSDNVLTGNSASNIINAGAGNDTVDGGAGNDTLYGGTGDDTFIVDSPLDVVIEKVNEGNDTIVTAASFTLAPNSNIENLTLGGSGDINGTGDGLNNTITGNSGNNILNGGGGNDIMIGGAGNDTYIVDSALDAITENINAGIDTVLSASNYSLQSIANVENLTLTGTGNTNATGNTANNTLTGNVGNNILNGGLGMDVLIGGAGNDIYILDDPGDTIQEFADQGSDTVQASANYTLGSNLENLLLQGSQNFNGTGNELNNILTGNSGNNTLTGGAGNDTLIGGAGDDTLVGGIGDDAYFIDTPSDTIIENLNEGNDTIKTTFSFSLDAINHIENLTLLGSANLNGTGNSMNNVITGNTGSNILDGGIGSDTLIGGAGNDSYFVDSVSDLVIENLNEGIDTVNSSVSYSLAMNPNIENLTLLGTADINGTGCSMNNTLIGNSGNNILDGGLGNDTMMGGAGNDTYIIDSMSDILIENTNEGIDTVQTSVHYVMAANIENAQIMGNASLSVLGNSLDNTITGNAANNIINGGAGNDIIDGGAGNDSLYGGTGNDTYVINSINDLIFENANEGIDIVQTYDHYAMAANLENAKIMGSGALSLLGNALGNNIMGNSGNNIINAGAGNDIINGGGSNDTLYGGAGNDTFAFDNGSGSDSIADFQNGFDLIDLTLWAVDNLSDLSIIQVGANAVISDGLNGSITLTGQSISALDVSDFIFS